MGCGAFCGDNSTILQPNQHSLQILLKIIPELKNVIHLISQKQYNLFISQIRQNPYKYRLNLTSSLVSGQQLDPRILRKWKIILFCHDNQNPHYIDCLGYKKLTKFKDPFQSQGSLQEDGTGYQFNIYDSLKQHSHFSTIRKDIDRTSNIPQNKKKQFQNVLKRITNQFPGMGYTQGMNFLIAFFLMIGYSQFDTFWIFVHLALNQRFLLLGFFQDNFPLEKNYETIFKNLLKRQNKKLYQRLYEQLKFPEDQWLIKWFITFFHYSFPIEIVPFAFDILINIGSIGLVTFSYGIIQELSQLIYQQDQVEDLFYEFSKLKNIQFFNANVNLRKAVEKAYKVKIKKQDLDGINANLDNFYSNYILHILQEDVSINKNISVQRTELILVEKQNLFKENLNQILITYNSESKRMLSKWYQQILVERTNFLKISNNSKKLEKILIQNNYQQFMIAFEHKNESKQLINQDFEYEHKNSVQDSAEMKNLTNPSTGYSFDKKSSRVKNGDINSQIDELWDEQDDTNSYVSKNISSKLSQQSRSQQGFDGKKAQPKYYDELEKLASTQNINPKMKNHSDQKSSNIFTNQQLGSLRPKINNFQRHEQPYKNVLIRAGSNIINNQNSKNKLDYDSANSQSSKNCNFRQKKQKQNNIDSKSKLINDKSEPGKVKTEGKKSINDDLSQHNSSIDPKNSIFASNQSIQEDIRNSHIQNEAQSMKKFDLKRQKFVTHQDIFINSLQASKKIQKNSGDYDSIESEIQIFQAKHGFKKKNRLQSRINGGIHSLANQNLKRLKLNHNTSDVNIHKKQNFTPQKENCAMDLNYQQSCESFYAASHDIEPNTRNFKDSIQNYQIESVK